MTRARRATPGWARRIPNWPDRPIAYFSAEFALHQSLPIYAGGLGVLAGDHCKEASDLGVPLIGVGFMYPQGYFHQRITGDGWQQEGYEKLNWADVAIEPATTADGQPCITAVPLGDRTVLVAVWRVRLGRVTLYLLDTDLEENAPWDRSLSARLYGGDRETRVQQEIILGIGGVRALRALGASPSVWHLNEGHAGFVVLQRIREFVDQGSSFESALEEVRRTTVFTTHTPVPAGHDAFNFQLVEKHLAGAWGSLGPLRSRFLALGEHDSGDGPQFNMTALALRASASVNGVSQLHGEVTRQMWASIWPGTDRDRACRSSSSPTASTSRRGCRTTWGSCSRRISARTGSNGTTTRRCGIAFSSVPDEEIWRVRRSLRNYLFSFIRQRARALWSQDRLSSSRVQAAGTLLDSDALTIGFARRFTGYKRPDLIFRDPERLARILTAPGRPVQIVFAGKSHPADDTGKHQLQSVYQHALDPAFAGRIAFVDDYDLHVAHFLVQGCDIWLNNPRKPLEASGTSGMKASINGVPHMSIGDGWWAEATTARTAGSSTAAIRAAIRGRGRCRRCRRALPAARRAGRTGASTIADRGIPQRWLQIVKEAIRTVAPQFSARRMVKEYVERMYAARQSPAGAIRRRPRADDAAMTKAPHPAIE